MDSEELAKLMEEFEKGNGPIEADEIVTRDFMNPDNRAFMQASPVKSGKAPRSSYRKSSKRLRIIEYLEQNSPVTANRASIDTSTTTQYVQRVAKEVGIALDTRPSTYPQRATPKRDAVLRLLKAEKELSMYTIQKRTTASTTLIRRVAKELGYLIYTEPFRAKYSKKLVILSYADETRTIDEVAAYADTTLSYTYQVCNNAGIKLRRKNAKRKE